ERARPACADRRCFDVHASRSRDTGGAAGVRGGQRKALVRRTTGERSEGPVPGLRHGADAPARLQGGALAVAGQIHALVAVDDGVDSQYVQSTLPDNGNVEIVGIINGIEESWRTLQETSPDLLLVACAGYSDRALYFIDSAVKQQPDRPVVVLTTGSPNGFVRRVFESGADDIVTLPESPDRIAFALEKAIARRRGAAVASRSALAPTLSSLGPRRGP